MKLLQNREPCGLKHWWFDANGLLGWLYTCARPGRSLGRRKNTINDATVIDWLNGLPKSGTITAIVSLLGRKPEPNERGEFSYYSFRSSHEDIASRPTFQEWLDRATAPGKYIVIEHPTTDTRPIPFDLLNAITESILANLREARTVVVVDSGGVSRTGDVIQHLRVKLDCELVPSQMTSNCPSR